MKNILPAGSVTRSLKANLTVLLSDCNLSVQKWQHPAKEQGFQIRPVWESQIDLEEFTEEEIELEIEELIQNNQSMAPDPEEAEKDNLMTTTVAMTAARSLRAYFQCHSAPREVLQALSIVENQLLKDKIESKSTKQTTFESFFVKPAGSSWSGSRERVLNSLPLNCSKCDKKFAFCSDLERDERIHTRKETFSCSQCDKKFTLPGDLKQHERIHTGEKTI